MKPIPFSTDMVRALQNGTKTATRRVVKQLCGVKIPLSLQLFVSPHSGTVYYDGADRQLLICEKPVVAPYRPGDVLYVRETWQEVYETEHDVDGSRRTVNIRDLILNFDDIPKVEAGISHDCATAMMEPRMKYYVFKASDIEYADPTNGLIWRPSIHMPREATRIFLRVTAVRVERLQDITEEQALAEGIFLDSPDFIPTYHYSKEKCNVPGEGWSTARECFLRGLWGSTIKPADRARYGWAANPWVWVIEFERISKEEAMM